MNTTLRTSSLEFEWRWTKPPTCSKFSPKRMTNVMLWGAPGIGKSSVVFQLGDRKDRKVIEFRTQHRASPSTCAAFRCRS